MYSLSAGIDMINIVEVAGVMCQLPPSAPPTMDQQQTSSQQTINPISIVTAVFMGLIFLMLLLVMARSEQVLL